MSADSLVFILTSEKLKFENKSKIKEEFSEAKMSCRIIVPAPRREAMFYDRPRSLFQDVFRPVDDGWFMVPYEEPIRRFDQEMDRFRRQMSSLHTQPFNMEHGSPFVTDSDGNRKLSVKVDCSQFKPEELTLKTKDGVLTIHAKRVEEGSDGKLYREFVRQFTLPENVDPATLKSQMNQDGVLQIEAPVPPSGENPKELVIPIEKVETAQIEDKKGAAK
ncbi:Hsp20/alpha crystallin [Mactra antiquata]